MKRLPLAMSVLALALAACSNSSSDQLADRSDDSPENRAALVDAQVNMFEEQARQAQETGEREADDARAANQKAAERNKKERDDRAAAQTPSGQ